MNGSGFMCFRFWLAFVAPSLASLSAFLLPFTMSCVAGSPCSFRLFSSSCSRRLALSAFALDLSVSSLSGCSSSSSVWLESRRGL